MCTVIQAVWFAYQPDIIELPVEDPHGVGRGALQAPPQPYCCLICDGLLHLTQIRPPPEHPACLASDNVRALVV